MSLVFVQGDTAPTVNGHIVFTSGGGNVNLTNATVKFQMRKPDDRRFTVNATAVVDNALGGLVSYSWAANDLAVPGTYSIQWEVTFQDARVQTTEAETIIVRRQ